jgi:hypothetical protein
MIVLIGESQGVQAQQPARITFKLYYLQGEPLFNAFLKKNDQDTASLAVREALKQAGAKVRVTVEEFDQNKQRVGTPKSKDFDLRIEGDAAAFFEGNAKTAIYVDITPNKTSFYTLTIDAPAIAGQSVPEGQSVLEPVILQKLHIEKMDISVVMPVARKTQTPPSDVLPTCEAYPIPPCGAYQRPCRLFGGRGRCKGR